MERYMPMPKEIGEAAILAIQNEIRRLEDKINGRFCAPLGDWQKVVFEERVEHLKMAITAIRWSTDYNWSVKDQKRVLDLPSAEEP